MTTKANCPQCAAPNQGGSQCQFCGFTFEMSVKGTGGKMTSAQKAKLFIKTGQYSKAKSLLKDYLEKEPFDVKALLQYTQVLFLLSGSAAEMVNTIKMILQIDKKNKEAKAYYLMLQGLNDIRKNSDFNSGIRKMKQAASLAPRNNIVLFQIASIYYTRKKNLGVAFTYVNSCLRLDRKNARALYLRANILKDSKKKARAITDLKACIECAHQSQVGFYRHQLDLWTGKPMPKKRDNTKRLLKELSPPSSSLLGRRTYRRSTIGSIADLFDLF